MVNCSVFGVGKKVEVPNENGWFKMLEILSNSSYNAIFLIVVKKCYQKIF